MTVNSTPNHLAASTSPEELRRAIGQQALWIERQKIHNESTHGRLGTLEVKFAEIIERLDQISDALAAARAERALWGLAAKALLALASLFVAARAAGVI